MSATVGVAIVGGGFAGSTSPVLLHLAATPGEKIGNEVACGHRGRACS